MKIDITVTKAMTVNMGNYENVRPEVTLTAKDIDSEKTSKVYEILQEIANDMFNLETAKQIDELKSVRETRANEYANIIKSRELDIEKDIQGLVESLDDI